MGIANYLLAGLRGRCCLASQSRTKLSAMFAMSTLDHPRVGRQWALLFDDAMLAGNAARLHRQQAQPTNGSISCACSGAQGVRGAACAFPNGKDLNSIARAVQAIVGQAAI